MEQLFPVGRACGHQFGLSRDGQPRHPGHNHVVALLHVVDAPSGMRDDSYALMAESHSWPSPKGRPRPSW